jgi:predicted PhzF superfamily epimerase YddE/YHI9
LKLASQYTSRFTHIYIRSNDEFDVKTRMFGPFDRMMEYPATVGANCALGGLHSHYTDLDTGEFELEIAQGI